MMIVITITKVYRHHDCLEDSKPPHCGKHCKDNMVVIKTAW